MVVDFIGAVLANDHFLGGISKPRGGEIGATNDRLTAAELVGYFTCNCRNAA
jgi:hypothetical protein